MLVVCCACHAWGQTPDLQSSEKLTEAQEFAAAQLESLKQASDLSEEVRKPLVDAYTEALNHVKSAQEQVAQAAAYQGEANAAPQLISEIEARLAEPSSLSPPSPTASLPDLETGLASTRNDLTEARKKEEDLRRQVNQRTERRKQLPDALSNAHDKLNALRSQLAAPIDPTVKPELSQAQRLALQLRSIATQAEISSLETELQTFDVLGRLLSAQLQEATQRVAELEERLRAYQQILSERRLHEVEEAASQARAAVLAEAHAAPSVVAFAESLAAENQDLARQRVAVGGIQERLAAIEERRKEISELRERVSTDFASISAQERNGDRSFGLGIVLQRYRTSLPDVSAHLRHVRDLQGEIEEVQLLQYNLEERQRSIGNIEVRVKEVLDSSGVEFDVRQKARLSKLLRDLFSTKRESISLLLADINSLFAAMADLVTQEQGLVDDTLKFKAFIEENVLWVRSSDILKPRDFFEAGKAVLWLGDASSWLTVTEALKDDFIRVPFLWGLLLVFVLGLLGFRRRLIRALHAEADTVVMAGAATFRPTVGAVLVTILLTMPAPVLLAWLGWRLKASLAPTPVVSVAAQAMYTAALLVGAAAFLRQACRKRGLAVVHLGWSSTHLLKLRRLTLLLLVFALLTFPLVYGLEAQDTLSHRNSLGRVLFIAGMLGLAWGAHRAFRLSGGPIMELLRLHLFRRPERKRRHWHMLAIIVPLALAFLAGYGYYYSAVRLTTKLFVSVCLATVAIFAAALVLRWLAVMHRRVAIEQARRSKSGSKEREGAATDSALGLIDEEDKVDVAKVGMQTRRLIRATVVLAFLVSLWIAWASELPALAVLDQMPLWQGATLTLGRLVRSGIFVIMTVVACRNVPGLLEIAVLQRMNLGGGERYAVRTLVAYGLAMLGAIAVFNNLGVQWSSLQWLVAAMGVGLGFGLQEIFANFISGLIILFERPMRVGDIVTIGGVSGTVSRIRIRATSIVSFDRKELIVPNKEFVTGQVVNWTLSDAVLRVVIPVGVAYGSDIRKVVDVLERVAKENPRVLTEPSPGVFFTDFGESTINLELRAFSPDLESVGKMRNELFLAIDKTFREEGIEIAFPQRDLHIRSIVPHTPSDLGQRPIVPVGGAESPEPSTPDDARVPPSTGGHERD